MATDLDPNDLKRLLKEAVAETLRENRDLLHEVFQDVLEDFALTEAIREGLKTKAVAREEVFQILKDES